MKTLTVGINDAGQRLDRFLYKAFPNVSAALFQKELRRKNIKINGKWAKGDKHIELNDIISIYINDDILKNDETDDVWKHIITPNIDVIYEDDNIILIDKKPGMVVHTDDKGSNNTLANHLIAYLYQKNEYRPDELSFTPALCNRIDRNTGGIVIGAKNAEALRILNEKIREREISKYYLCAINGKMSPPSGELVNYIFKDEKKKRVTVYDKSVIGSKTSITKYKTLTYHNNLSLIMCKLLTGRTHQIRAQFSHAGCPLLGDGKYGILDKKYNEKYQALYSFKLVFDFKTDAGSLEYLKGKSFYVQNIPFLSYFPNCPKIEKL